MADTAEEIGQKATEKFGELTALMTEVKEAVANGDQADRIENLSAKAEELGNDVAELKQKQAAAEAEEAKTKRISALEERIAELAASSYSPSKAEAILSGQNRNSGEPDVDSFFRHLINVKRASTPMDVRAASEKALADLGSTWQDVPAASKATLGETDANGGYLAPRAVVAEATGVAVANNPYRNLLTVVTGILGPTVEVPHIGLAPSRATVQARGATKTNVGVSLANYTATFYTIAVIHDAANQWLRQTGGAGERLIRKRGAEAISLGESYYILNGSGTSEPKGLLTSLGTSGTFVTSHTAAQTTIAGNIASGLAKASGALADRNRTPSGAVMNAGDFWIVLASGADSAGFYINPAGGASEVNATGGFSNGAAAIRLWGIPLYADPNMPPDSLVVGDWKGAEMYLGDGFRVDVSTEAGDRWDKNLTGFRFEEELAFNADPYVVSGLFQRLIDTKA
jgi:HK97 family phage major capsid protein